MAWHSEGSRGSRFSWLGEWTRLMNRGPGKFFHRYALFRFTCFCVPSVMHAGVQSHLGNHAIVSDSDVLSFCKTNSMCNELWNPLFCSAQAVHPSFISFNFISFSQWFHVSSFQFLLWMLIVSRGSVSRPQTQTTKCVEKRKLFIPNNKKQNMTKVFLKG